MKVKQKYIISLSMSDEKREVMNEKVEDIVTVLIIGVLPQRRYTNPRKIQSRKII